MTYCIITYNIGHREESRSNDIESGTEAYGTFLAITTGASLWSASLFYGDHLLAESSYDEDTKTATITWHGYA